MARTYTAEQREAALAAYVDHGGAEASRLTGVNAATIRKWAERCGATGQRAMKSQNNIAAARRTWAERRAETVLRLGEVAAELIERADRAENPKAAADAMRATKDAITTAELLSGSPTERVETSQLEQEIERELEALMKTRERNAAARNGDGP